jgi:uncharacterized protein YhaN
MKISNITPKLFGRYRTDAPLDLPNSSIVVVYGNNEVGKTTYADMAVTLLSSTYDKDIVKRYGNYKDQMKGSIEIIDGAESLTIQFKSATIPANSGGNVKRDGQPTNALWNRAQAIQYAILRNIFRVFSHEITDGEASKKKFDDYGLGDRSGASIRTILADYDSKSGSLKTQIRGTKTLIGNLKTQLRAANQSFDKYEELVNDLARTAQEIKEVRENERKEAVLQQQISFCEGSQNIAAAGQLASLDLHELDKNGRLIPILFSDASPRVRQIIEDIDDLKIQDRKTNLENLTTDLGIKTQETNAALASLSLTREHLLANVTLANDESRQALLGHLLEHASSRSTQIANSSESEIMSRQSELDDAKSELIDANTAWEKFDTNVTAEKYTYTSPSNSGSSDSISRFSIPNWSFGIPILGLIIALISQQPTGVGVSLAFTILLAFLRKSPPKSNVRYGDERVVDHDESIVQVAAQRVINAGIAVSGAQQRLDSLQRSEQRRLDVINNLSTAIQEILDQYGFTLSSNADVPKFTFYFDELRKAVNLCTEEGKLRIDAEAESDSLAHLQTRLNALIGEVQSIYVSYELAFNEALFNNANAACTTLESLLAEFDDQSDLRSRVKAVDELFIERNDEVEVRLLMKMSPEDRAEKKRESEEKSADFQDDRTNREGELRGLKDAIEAFENTSQMTSLRSQVESLKRLQVEQEMAQLQYDLQAKLLRKFATQRAQDLKPELVKNVQDMVLSVAKDWKNIEFLTDSVGKIEHIEVRKSDDSVVTDSQLSSGAQSLLYLAMRVAIMQQEAKNGLSIPLFCDDPLIYMDDTRTRLALQMLKEASEGHQIIYFTCKTEIRELAEEMNIPVVTI